MPRGRSVADEKKLEPLTEQELAELYKKSAVPTPAGNDDEVRRGAHDAARGRGLTEEAAAAEAEHAVMVHNLYSRSRGKR